MTKQKFEQLSLFEVPTIYKDLTFDYEGNGYKFLGWLNLWKRYPKEYLTCKSLNHKLMDVSRGNRGYENIVSCDTCKIYWKYDSSD